MNYRFWQKNNAEANGGTLSSPVVGDGGGKSWAQRLSTTRGKIAFVSVFAVVGASFIIYSHAATPTVAFEPEGSALTTGASVGTDSQASGGKYLQFGGNSSTPPVQPPVTPPSTSGFFPRGMYENSDTAHNALFSSLGFNLSNVGANTSAVSSLAANGMKGLVWLGGYNDSNCSMAMSDATVTAAVNSIKSSSSIYGYFLIDEPENHLYACPNIPAQVAARAKLVKSLDPNHLTFTVVSNSAYVKDSSGSKVIEKYPYHYFTTNIDMMGLDIYPCHQPASSTCDFSDIDKAIAAADAQNVKHYLAILQDFEDTNWRRPTPAEVQTQFDHWSKSRMEGYLIFSWDWQGNSLDGNTSHQNMLKTENARKF